MIDTTTYLGSARIVRTEGRSRHVEVELPDGGRGWARLALAVPYAAAKGDEVLVIGQDAESLFVVGLLEGSGASTLRVPGDLRIEAPDGSVTISSGRDVRIEAPRLEARVGVFDLTARRLIEKVHDAFRWVAGLFHVRSQRAKLLTESTLHVKAGSASLRADGPMNIDGETINLG